MELEAIVRRIREEFREMPGLRLTLAQATRLWGLEHGINEHRVALRECAARRILARQAHRELLVQERAEGERFAGRPVDAFAGLDHAPFRFQETDKRPVQMKILRRGSMPHGPGPIPLSRAVVAQDDREFMAQQHQAGTMAVKIW